METKKKNVGVICNQKTFRNLKTRQRPKTPVNIRFYRGLFEPYANIRIQRGSNRLYVRGDDLRRFFFVAITKNRATLVSCVSIGGNGGELGVLAPLILY